MSVIKRIFAHALLVVATALSVSCTGSGNSSGDAEVMIKQIRLADRALLQAEDRRDLDGAMAFIASHAVFQPPGRPPIAGEEAIRRFYEQQWFKLPYSEISGNPVTIVVAASGDLAYLDGRSHMVMEVSGEQVIIEGKYLGVWQRIKGQWRLVAISWTANQATR